MTRRFFGTTFGIALLCVLSSGSLTAARAADVATTRDYVPHEVVVRFADGGPGAASRLPAGIGVGDAVRALRENPDVAYASPNYIATASAVEQVPNDPGTLSGVPSIPGSWVSKQWGFLPWEGPGTPLVPVSPGGIDAVGAWANLAAAKRPGAKGVTVAVLDTGVAYRALGGRFRRSPDFGAGQFTRGFDFVQNNRLPLDRNGHGTHVAGTIAEKTNNGIGLTGLAYRAKLMPVRVLDRLGSGRADDIAAGIRFAVDQGADVINMSFNFGCGKEVPNVAAAARYADRKGVVLVASVGNLGSESCVSSPATIDHVIGVGGATEGGCLGTYSLAGKDVDVVAPGGGEAVASCASVLADPIYQVTFRGSKENRFGEPGFYVGTSMAAAHVSGVAAMVLASGVLDDGKKAAPIPAQVAARLKQTARSLGASPLLEGAGLIDAARATDPGCREACFSGRR